MIAHVDRSSPGFLRPILQPDPSPSDRPAQRRILVCVDRSPLSEACVSYAIVMAKSSGDAITILLVVEPSTSPGWPGTANRLDGEILRRESLAYLERLEETTRAAGGHVDCRLEQGTPAACITAVARELDVNLTVLACASESGPAQRLGTTLLRVLGVARGSVLIVRPSLGGHDIVPPKRILVPLDGSLRAEGALPTAARLARTNHGELLLALVVGRNVPTGPLSSPEDLALANVLTDHLVVRGQAYLEGLRRGKVLDGTSTRTTVLRSGDERQALLDLCDKDRSDLMVVSAHGAGGKPALAFGGVAVHFLEHSAVSLLVVQDARQRRDVPAPAH
jgi:nucleotide-binding universal stress UspA family protein